MENNSPEILDGDVSGSAQPADEPVEPVTFRWVGIKVCKLPSQFLTVLTLRRVWLGGS